MVVVTAVLVLDLETCSNKLRNQSLTVISIFFFYGKLLQNPFSLACSERIGKYTSLGLLFTTHTTHLTIK